MLDDILGRLPATLELITAAMLLAVPLGSLLGILSARCRHRSPDLVVRVVLDRRCVDAGVLARPAAPGRVLPRPAPAPATGRVDANLRFTSPITEITGFYLVDTVLTGNWTAFRDVAWHPVLPALTLAAYPIGLIARMTRY